MTKGIGSVTHFMECCRRVTGSRTPIGTVVDPPAILKKPAAWPSSCSLEDLKLYVPPVRRDGSIVDWAKDIHDNWSFSEDGGYRGTWFLLTLESKECLLLMQSRLLIWTCFRQNDQMNLSKPRVFCLSFKWVEKQKSVFSIIFEEF